MKKLFLITSTILITLSTYGQDITGQWNGILKVQGTQLRLVLHINQTDNGYKSTMDSPDQGAKDIPVSLTSFENSILIFEVAAIGVTYSGTLNSEGMIDGIFKQMGQSLPLSFSRKEVKKEELIRPQEPKKPYPYYSEEVSFTNAKDTITLSGTLTLPSKEGNFPIVVMITGSGPQNRDEELLGHKPFLVIADHLTKKGIGVLRFDDRGTAKSTGDFNSANTIDFASDVHSAVEYLKTRKDINQQKIGLVGHSEGGLIAPIVASESEDIAFIVLLAGTGISGYDILLLQTEMISKANGMDESDLKVELAFLKGALDIIIKDGNVDKLKTSLTDYAQNGLKEHPELLPEGMDMEGFIKNYVDQLVTPWMQYFLKYNPASSLTNVKCPVLAINGEKDLQVPAKINLASIEKYLNEGGNNNVTIKELLNLNHLFQECETGSPNEYATIEQTFSPIALAEISDWILEQVK